MQKLFTLVLGSFAAAFVLGGCSDDTELGSSHDALTAGRQLDESEVASLLANAGVPSQDIPKLVCIAQYESGLYERSTHRNANHTTDWGIFQINDVHRGRTANCPADSESLMVAANNAACAASVARGPRGLANWSQYRAHTAECDAYRLAGDYGAQQQTAPTPPGTAGSYGKGSDDDAGGYENVIDENTSGGGDPKNGGGAPSCDPYVDPSCDPYGSGYGYDDPPAGNGSAGSGSGDYGSDDPWWYW